MKYFLSLFVLSCLLVAPAFAGTRIVERERVIEYRGYDDFDYDYYCGSPVIIRERVVTKPPVIVYRDYGRKVKSRECYRRPSTRFSWGFSFGFSR